MDLNELTLAAIKASRSAGKEILKYYKKDIVVEQKQKDDYDSPLTIADLSAHNAIKSFLAKATPGLPVFSEESKDIDYKKRKAWKSFWLVDPLDGTKEFIRQNGEFTVNIALIKKNLPILGVVYAPAISEIYFANRDIGSFRTDLKTSEKILNIKKVLIKAKKLEIDKNKFKKDKIKAVVSRSYLTKETQDYLDRLQKNYKNPIKRVSFGSSLKLCRVAENKADIYPNLGNKSEWDIAAGHAVIKFAGGNIVNYESEKELVYNKENILTPYFIAQ